MTPADRIRRLVAAGTVAPEEGARLLDAMGHERPHLSRFALLVNPFDRFGGGFATGLGAAIAALSLGIARFGIRFDGFLDLHTVNGVVTLRTALLDQVVAWLIPAILFFAYSR